MFLILQKNHRGQFLVPTYDIDIAWHTHQVGTVEIMIRAALVEIITSAKVKIPIMIIMIHLRYRHCLTQTPDRHWWK
jgi:hypothetical protein